MKNKKILFLVTQSEFGGAQRFIYTLICGLTQINTRINTDITVAAGPDGDDEKGLLSALEKQGIKTKHLKYLRRSINPLFDFCLGIIEIYRLIKKEKPDILFLCSSKAGAMGSLAARYSQKFVYKNSHLLVIYRIGGWTFNDPRCFLINWYYILIEKISAKWKDYIISNAECDRKQAIQMGIKPRKEIFVIYNGIGDLEFLSREKAREFLELKDSEFVVGTIANDYPTKGLKYLKKAMENIDGKLVIIGKGNRYIPDAYKYLKAFDVFVLPSVKEGFPWTILEAIKAEIPIVATGVGAIPEIIDEYIEPRNVQDLIKAIKAPKKFEFNKKFSLEAMIKKYEDLLFIN